MSPLLDDTSPEKDWRNQIRKWQVELSLLWSLLDTGIHRSAVQLPSKSARASCSPSNAYGHESNLAGTAKRKHNVEWEALCQIGFLF